MIFSIIFIAKYSTHGVEEMSPVMENKEQHYTKYHLNYQILKLDFCQRYAGLLSIVFTTIHTFNCNGDFTILLLKRWPLDCMLPNRVTCQEPAAIWNLLSCQIIKREDTEHTKTSEILMSDCMILVRESETLY